MKLLKYSFIFYLIPLLIITQAQAMLRSTASRTRPLLGTTTRSTIYPPKSLGNPRVPSRITTSITSLRLPKQKSSWLGKMNRTKQDYKGSQQSNPGKTTRKIIGYIGLTGLGIGSWHLLKEEEKEKIAKDQLYSLDELKIKYGFNYELSDDKSNVIIRLKDQKDEQVAVIMFHEKRPSEKYCGITFLHIENKYRNLRIGSSLLNTAINKLEALGCDSIYVEARPMDPRVNDRMLAWKEIMNFYKKFGFKELEQNDPVKKQIRYLNMKRISKSSNIKR